PAGCSRRAGPPAYWAVTNASTSAATTRRGGLPTTAKNTFKSYATAATVFGRDRTARNSRYASSSATPNRTTRSPVVDRDRRTRRSLQDIQEPHSPTHRQKPAMNQRGLPAYQADPDSAAASCWHQVPAATTADRLRAVRTVGVERQCGDR